MQQERHQVVMTEGNIRTQMLRFALPIFVGHFFQQLYNTVDSLIVGNLLGPEALASVTSTAAYVYLMTGFFMGFSQGAGVVIARHVGARDEGAVRQAEHTAVALGLVSSALITLLGVTLSPTVLRLMGTPDNVFDQSSAYLCVYFSGAGFLVMYNMFVAILQAAGDSTHPLMYLIISSLLNIVLDYFFVGALKMGVEGAALATVICEAVSMLLSMIRLMRMRGALRLSLREIRLHANHARRILRYGLPTAMQMGIIDLSNMLVQSYINSFGSAAMAGIGASSRVEGFTFLPIMAFSMGLTTFVSQNLGARRKDRIREGIRFGVVCTTVVIGLIGGLTFLFAPRLVGLFSGDPEIIRYGTGRMRTCALFFVLVGFTHIASAIVRGLGRPMNPMVVTLVCWCLVRVVVLFTIGQVVHDIRLIYWIYPVTWSLSTIYYIFYLRRLYRGELRQDAA